MPCTMTGSIEGDRALAHTNTVTELAQLLCEATRVLKKTGHLNKCSDKLKKWHAEHVKIDEVNYKQKKEEVALKMWQSKMKIINSLSDDEKKALHYDRLCSGCGNKKHPGKGCDVVSQFYMCEGEVQRGLKPI
jgi:hypothetical protein